MRAAALTGSVLVLALGLYAGARPVGPLPALGPLLDPASGIWAVARGAELPVQAEAQIPGLSGSVEVLYDERRVPHIFASNMPDLHRALGYVVGN